jgi:type IX secretion system PorP/SprF family membrane protein
MKNFKLIISVIFIYVFDSTAVAQQTPLFGMTSQILNVTNPAMTRTINPLNVSLLGRKYWTKMEGSPEAFLGTFSLSPNAYKSALGGVFWSEKAPLFSKQVIGVNYAYSLKNMDEGSNLRFGTGLDFISISSNNGSIYTDDYNDPFYTSLIGNVKSAIDFKAGLAWNNEVLEIGIAMQQLLKSKNNVADGNSGKLAFNNPTITSGHIKYTLQLDEDLLITPLVYWQAQKSIPLRVDINLLAEKTGKLWGGLWLRPKSSMGLLAGIWVLPDVKMGYMYEKAFLNSTTNVGGSHELLISYSPKFNHNEKAVPETEVSDNNKPEPKIIRVRDTIVIVKETRIVEKPAKTTPSYTPKEESRETEPIQSETPKTSSNGSEFYVVSGLFSLENNAKLYANKLKAAGYKAAVMKNPDANQFYVSVGKFNSLVEAHQYIDSNLNDNFKFWVKEIAGN